MRQAIVTKYLPPTDSRGARIVARAAAGRRYFDWGYSADPAQNHAQAAEMFAYGLNWLSHCDLKGGCMPDGRYCFVLVERNSK